MKKTIGNLKNVFSKLQEIQFRILDPKIVKKVLFIIIFFYKAFLHIIMMLDDIKADETYEKIKRRAMDRECWRNWMPRTCFQAEHQ